MDLKTVDRQPTRVACLRYTGPFGPGIGDFWRQTVAPWLKANNLNVSTFGIARDDPQTTAPERLRYDACAEVKPDFIGSGPYNLTVIPGGKYAVATFTGTAAEIGAAWGTLMSETLPASGLKFDASRMPLEHYAKDFAADPQTGAFTCELLVPVESEAAVSASV
jgi:AraC family transcriptional regulator